MKYRDLVFILVLVAVAVVWLSSDRQPEVARADEAQTNAPSTPFVEKTPVSIDGWKRKSSPETIDKRLFASTALSGLTISPIGTPEKLEDLVVKVTVDATTQTINVPVDNRGVACVSFSLYHQERIWNFPDNSVDLKGSIEVQKGSKKSWEIPLSRFERPPNFHTVAELYGREPIKLVAFLDEDAADPNPMSRRISVLLTGETVLEPR